MHFSKTLRATYLTVIVSILKTLCHMQTFITDIQMPVIYKDTVILRIMVFCTGTKRFDRFNNTLMKMFHRHDVMRNTSVKKSIRRKYHGNWIAYNSDNFSTWLDVAEELRSKHCFFFFSMHVTFPMIIVKNYSRSSVTKNYGMPNFTRLKVSPM